MESSRNQLMEKIKAKEAQFEVCKHLAYEHPEYQKYFQMSNKLADFIIEEHQNARLDGKDLYNSHLDLEQLFALYREPEKSKNAQEQLKTIKKDIHNYIHNDK